MFLRIPFARRLAALMLTIGLMVVAAVPVSASSDGLYMHISDMLQNEEGLTLSISYVNPYDTSISLGWVHGSDVVVTTDQGTFTESVGFMGCKLSNNEGCFDVTLEDCVGQVKTVTLSEVILLDDRGLPARRVYDFTLYDHGQNGAVCDFSRNSFLSKLPMILAVLIGLTAVGGIVLLIVLTVKKRRSPKPDTEPTVPYAPSPRPRNIDAP